MRWLRAAGWHCFQGLTPACGSDCSGAPLLPLGYVAANLAFNVSVLSLIRMAGNVGTSLVMSAMVPLTIWAFTVSARGWGLRVASNTQGRASRLSAPMRLWGGGPTPALGVSCVELAHILCSDQAAGS